MPYTSPTATTTAAVPFPSQGRSGHRRSFSHIMPPDSFASTSTTGAFTSLGSLPRRRASSAMPISAQSFSAPSTPTHKKPTFQLGRDDDDDSPDESPDDFRSGASAPVKPAVPVTNHHDDDDFVHPHLPPLRLKTKMLSSFEAPRASPPPQILIHPSTAAPSAPTPTSIPFPRSSPLTSPTVSQPSTLPFPGRSTTSSDPRPPTDPSSPRPIRPSVARTSSTPILLSNGKPLKSSLKSSSSSPNIPFPPQSLVPSIMFPDLHQQPTHHQRARSAPSTPHLGSIADPMAAAADGNYSPPSSTGSETPPLGSPSPSPSPPPQKNVHFPSQEEGGLATVRLFNRKAKPASLSRLGDETETETEGESSSVTALGSWGSVGSKGWSSGSGLAAGGYTRGGAYPFPKVPGSGSPKSPLGNKEEASDDIRYEIDMNNSSPVPARGAERADANIYFESLGFLCEAGSGKSPRVYKPTHPLTLTGTVLVRNVAYQKTVAVRFTLDDWHTTNDVLAKHEKSLAGLPERFLLASLPTSGRGSEAESRREVVCRPYGFEDVVEGSSIGGPAWDRFRFSVSLESYESTLENRTMFFVGRYAAGALGSSLGVPNGNGEVTGDFQEWWDNNTGANYKVSFAKRVVADRRKEEEDERKRREGVASKEGHLSVPSLNGAGYRRAVVLSAPPSFTPAKPYPAPPQISSSTSYPSSALGGMDAQQRAQHQQHQAALTQSTLARLKKLNLRNYAAPVSYSGPSTPGGLSVGPDGHARVTSTSSTDSVSSVMSNSSTSSSSTADSTPLQTPTQGDDDQDEGLYKRIAGDAEKKHDVNVNVLQEDDEEQHLTDNSLTPTFHGSLARPRWGLSSTRYGGLEGMPGMGMGMGMENGFPATMSPPGGLAQPTPTRSMAIDISGNAGRAAGIERDVLSPLPLEMGTSPPFSALAGLGGMGSMRSPPPPVSGATDGNGYWPWASFGGPEKENVPTSTPVANKPTSNAPSASTSSLSAGAGSAGSGPALGPGPLAPPQRKRSSHHGGHKASFSVGKGGSNSSSSGSDSGSDTGTVIPDRQPHISASNAHTSTSNGHGRESSKWKRGSPTSSTSMANATGTGALGPQSWPAPPASSMSASFANSKPMSSVHNSLSQALGRNGSLGATSTPPLAFPGSPKRFFAPLPRTESPVPMSPLRMSPVNSTSNLAGIAEQEVQSPVPQDDAVYQAFVRQWCFAQGPGPAVGTSAPAGEKRGAVVGS